jgi:hypothetical protein
MSQAEGQLQALLAGGGLTAAERTEAQTLLGPGASAPASSSSSALTQLLQNILGNHG